MLDCTVNTRGVESIRVAPLMLVAQKCYVSTVDALLTAGAATAIRSDRAIPALDLVAYYGHIDVLKAIIDSGWDLDFRRELAYTALHTVDCTRQTKCSTYLPCSLLIRQTRRGAAGAGRSCFVLTPKTAG